MINKTFIKLLSAVIMMTAGMCMTSCGGDDPKPTEPPGSEAPTEPSEPEQENILAFDIVDHNSARRFQKPCKPEDPACPLLD